jgi:hypothetical protein
MFVRINKVSWNLEMIAGYQRNKKTGEYLLFFPIAGGNVKLKRDNSAYAVVDEYLSRKTHEG